jgi:uracil-DNA glycosylase
MHPARTLWSEHQPLGGYPAGVVPVPEPITGTAFFPGGFGLWNPSGSPSLPPFPLGGVMVLGHDFHSEAGYQDSLERGRERETQPTWLTLVWVLRRAEIPLTDCFFTNVYMGLRKGSGTTGPFPGAADKVFVAHCRKFLIRQLDVQRPSLVITLGVYAPQILASVSPQLPSWADRPGLKNIDETGPVRIGVSVSGLEGFTTTVVALVHPSLRSANLRHRRYKEAVGDAAEMLMLRDACRGAGIPSTQ